MMRKYWVEDKLGRVQRRAMLAETFRENYGFVKKEKRHNVYARFVEAYAVKTQTSVETGGKDKPYDTDFSFTASGVFENEPKPESMEKMTRNSMVAAFNSGKKKGRFIQKNLMGRIVDGGMRGYEARKVRVRRAEVTNRIKLRLEIEDRRRKSVWKGEN